MTDSCTNIRELLAADPWVFCDGPMHQTRLPQVVYGVRGVTSVQMTAYGAAVDRQTVAPLVAEHGTGVDREAAESGLRERLEDEHGREQRERDRQHGDRPTPDGAPAQTYGGEPDPRSAHEF